MFDRVISDLYQNKEIDDCISKFVRYDLFNDFKQELFLIICQQSKDKVVQMYETGQIKFFIIRIIINLVSQKRNVFHKNYLNQTTEVQDVEDQSEEYNHEKDIKIEKMIKDISEMDSHFGTFYHRALVELFLKHGSIREISDQTGIPKRTLYRSMEVIKNHLKNV